MKYIECYDDYVSESMKEDSFILLNKLGPKIKIVRDAIWGKKIGDKKLGLLNPLTKVAAGLGITISLIYLLMWHHNKKLDKLQPEIETKLKKYQVLLDSEFTAKELDDFVRLIASDKKVLNSVLAVLDGTQNPEDNNYLKSRFTKEQIEKINRLSNKINALENTNESLNEAEWYEVLGLQKKDVSHIKTVADIQKDPKIKIAYNDMYKKWNPDKGAGIIVPHGHDIGKHTDDLNNAYNGVGTFNNWYEVLGLKKSDVSHIKPNMTSKDVENDPKIKSAYFNMSKKLHPDKNPNDPYADANFSRLGDASKGINDVPKDNIGKGKTYPKGFGNSSGASGSTWGDNWSDADREEYARRGGVNPKYNQHYSDIADNSFSDKKNLRFAKKLFGYFDIGLIIKQYTIDSILSLGITYILTLNSKVVLDKIIKQDRNYEFNLEILQYVYNNMFDKRDIKELNIYFESDLELINYTQRMNRISNLNDRKRLSDVISEHISQNMPAKLYKKYKGFIKIGEDNNLFKSGSVTPHSLLKTYGREYTMDMLKQHILPEIKFYN